MASGDEVVGLLEKTVEALAEMDAPALLRLEGWALELELAWPPLNGTQIHSIGKKMAVLRATLEATAANMRLLRRLRGEDGAMAWVR